MCVPSYNARPVANALLRVEEEGAAGLVLQTGPVGAVVEHAAVIRIRKVRVVFRPAVNHGPVTSHQALT